MSDWISVEKKRPKRGQMVVWYHQPIEKAGHASNGRTAYYRADKSDLPSRPASHWMPLPEPPCET